MLLEDLLHLMRELSASDILELPTYLWDYTAFCSRKSKSIFNIDSFLGHFFPLPIFTEASSEVRVETVEGDRV